MQIWCPGCVPRNYLQFWYSLLALETKIRSPKQPRKKICVISDLSAQLAFRGAYLLAVWPELGLPHVQIEGIVEAHNFSSQTFVIRGRISLWIYTERSCCSGMREYLSGWVDLVGKPPISGVLRVDALVLGPFWVMFITWLDLWWASWSSHKVFDELIPKVSSLTLISFVNNKLQKPHASVNLVHHLYA
jgi:hypothetical protein